MGFINDNAQVLLTIYTWLGIILRNSIYPVHAINWYEGVIDPTRSVRIPFSSVYFLKTMKIFLNKQGYPQKGYMRNIVFNWLRCEWAGIIYSLGFGGTKAFFENDNELIYKYL